MIGRRRLPQRLGRFLGEERGNAAVIFAFVLLPLLAGTGLAIDSMLAFTVEERLQKSLDAAGLAAGNTVDPNNIEPDARAFFNSNFGEAPDLATVTGPNVQVSPDGTEITLTASATMPTRFMHLFGQDSVTVNATSVINRATRGMELVLVLDNTHSMVLYEDRMGALQRAAKDLVDIVYGNRTSVLDLWVGVVPYAATVNIGTANIAFLSATDRVHDSSSPFAPDSWGGCVLARPAPRDQTDDPPSVARFSSYLYPDVTYPTITEAYYKPIYNNNWGTDVSPSSRKKTENAYGPYWSGWGPNVGCPPPITPLVAQKGQIVSAINAMKPWDRWGTEINMGLVWGWRVLSPRWRGLWSGSPAQLPLDYNTPNMDKVIVALTDGDNEMPFYPPPDGTIPPYSAYETPANLGASTRDGAIAALNSRTRAVCNAIRGAGIILYTITVGSQASSQGKNLMRDCASSSAHYFHSPNGGTLQMVFRSIGSQLANLRIAR